MTFKRGDPKPPTSGRKKGTPSKTTVARKARLDETLAKHGVCIEDEIAKAVQKGDVNLLRALQGLLPYLQPRISAEVAPAPPTPDPDSDVPTDELLSAVQNRQ